jgi:CRISP-associated protein Cas1
VRIQVCAAGYDPTIGFFHAGRGGRSDFVLDLMEPLRPIVDRHILQFVQAHTFHPEDFTIRSDGVCNPGLGLLVARLAADTLERPRDPWRRSMLFFIATGARRA